MQLRDTREAQASEVEKINWRRVVLCGFLTGLVWGMLYAAAFPLVGGHRIPGNVPGWPFRGTSVSTRGIMMVWPFVQGIWTIWLYAAIRPRYGPGPRTAAVTGFAVWFFVTWVDAFWATLGVVSLTELVGPVAANLPITLVGTVVGAWPYKE